MGHQMGQAIAAFLLPFSRALRVHAAAENLMAERERWVLWIPVFLGIGIGAYFSLPAEPPTWIAWAATGISVATIIASRTRPILLILALAITCAVFGFSIATWRTAIVDAPHLDRRVGPTMVVGRIEAVEPRTNGVRLTMSEASMDRLSPDNTPERVRIVLRGDQPGLSAGAMVRVLAILSPPPPPPPSAPGAFDFQRQSYFRHLGAVGFSVSPATVLTGDDQTRASRHILEDLRRSIGERVSQAVDGTAGAVAVALMIGERGAIPADVMQAICDSGLAHLLAISGLHIGLVAGILFGGMRGGLALAGPLALRYPIKKWAAVIAIAGALFYALIAGATVPTQRAFLMIGLVLLAVLLDRRGISMRMVAWAAVIILVLSPESLLGASFQMSFAAVNALVATYEFLRQRATVSEDRGAIWRRVIILYVGGVALTSIVAASATAPFVIHHFNRVAAYGLAANLIAVPITALWVMPWAVIAFVLMPIGLEALVLAPIGWGIEAIITVAEPIAKCPGAVSVIPPMSVWGLAIISLGGLWVCLWTRPWRVVGLAAVIGGLAGLFFVQPPDILVDDEGRLLAVRTAAGGLAISSTRRGRFERETWLRRAGLADASPWPQQGASADGRLTCDELGCLYRANENWPLWSRSPMPCSRIALSPTS
jgi:competence protein ComEC